MEDNNDEAGSSSTVVFIRDQTRHDIAAHREAQRADATDASRGILDGKRRIRPEEVTDVVNLMKRKRSKRAHMEALYFLSHAFEQSKENTDAFLSVPGSMEMLVKKLEDVRENQQIHAAQCFCNMTLAGRRATDKIVRMAGSYLIIYLDSELIQLKRYSLWCLANIISVYTADKDEAQGKGNRCLKLLLDMNVFMALWQIYTAHENEQVDDEQDFTKDAGKALQRLVMADGIQLRPQDKEYLWRNLSMKTATGKSAEYYLCIVTHAGIIGHATLTATDIRHLMNFSLNHISSPTIKFSEVYAVIVLTKLLQHYGGAAATYLLEWTNHTQTGILALLTKMLENSSEVLRRCVLMMTAQIIKIPQHENPFVGNDLMEICRFHNSLTAIDC